MSTSVFKIVKADYKLSTQQIVQTLTNIHKKDGSKHFFQDSLSIYTRF